MAALGVLLTEIWRRNNDKTHFYAEYWLRRVAELEKKLSEGGHESILFATEILNRPRSGRIRHRDLVQAVPMIFFIAWITLFGLGISKELAGWSDLVRFLCAEKRPMYDLVSLFVSAASLLVGAAAAWIAASSLWQAKQVAEGERRDWKQRKWFDLYLKADEAYDALDHFQTIYPDASSPGWGSTEWEGSWNDLMRVMRTVNRMAVVFPKDSAIDDLFNATAGFTSTDAALSKERLVQLLNAVEGLRQKALINQAIL